MTLGWLTPAYPWIKAFHLIAVIAWMAGMFYLPRLFVYHTQTEPGSRESERFKVMETKLLRVIMGPAMLASWGLGLLLVLTPGVVDWSSGWWHLKLLGVVAMTGLHGMFAKYRREFLHDRNQRPERFFRAMNEAPTVAVVVIVIMVIVKPF